MPVAGAEPFSVWHELIHHLGSTGWEGMLGALETVLTLQEPLFSTLPAKLGTLWDPCEHPNHPPSTISKAGQTCSVTCVTAMLCHRVPNGQDRK